MTNVFTAISSRLKDSPVIVITMIFAILGGLIASVLYVEDLWSSYAALEIMQSVYGVVTPTNAVVFMALSALPQIGSTLMGWTFASDTDKKLHLAGAAVLEACDILADLYYRTDKWELFFGAKNYLENGGDSAPLTGFMFALGITLAISGFSIFLFILSWGIVLEGFTPSVVQFAKAWSGIKKAIGEAQKAVNGTTQNERRQPNSQQSSVQTNPQESRPAQPIRDPNRAQAQNQRRQ